MDYLKGISHCTFTCRHYKEMNSFFGDVLGLEKTFTLPYNQPIIDGFIESGYDTSMIKPGDEWITYWTIVPGQFIELFNLPYNGENNTRNEGFHHISLRVDDIEEAYRELARKGQTMFTRNGRTPKELKPGLEGKALTDALTDETGALSLEILDPEGNHFVLIQHTEDAFRK